MLELAWLDDLLVHNAAVWTSGAAYALKDAGLWSTPAARPDIVQRPRAHGADDRGRWYDPRVLSIAGWSRGDTPLAAQDAHDELKRRLALNGSPHTFKFRRLGRSFDEFVRFRQADLDGDPLPGMSVVEWSATLVCDDPRIYSDAVNQASYDPTTASAQSGVAFPLTFPLVFGVTTAGLTVQVDGSVETPPTYTISGPIVGPIIDNETTGASIYTSETALSATDWLTIDVGAKSVTVNGNTERPDLIEAGLTRWADLAPGPNVLRLRGSFMATGQTELTVSYRDARI